MKKLMAMAAAVAMSGAVMTAAPHEAKADGGAIAIGVAAYLVTDAIVGDVCHLRTWPFNIIVKVGRELEGKRACHRHHYRHHR